MLTGLSVILYLTAYTSYTVRMSKFSCFYLATPPIKLKVELHIHDGVLIATPWTNHCDRPIRNTEPQSGAIYYTLFGMCTIVLYLLPATGKLHKFGAEKLIS
jgi:hypothetical protein